MDTILYAILGFLALGAVTTVGGWFFGIGLILADLASHDPVKAARIVLYIVFSVALVVGYMGENLAVWLGAALALCLVMLSGLIRK